MLPQPEQMSRKVLQGAVGVRGRFPGRSGQRRKTGAPVMPAKTSANIELWQFRNAFRIQALWNWVECSTSGKFQKSMIGVMEFLPIRGAWSGTIEIRCAAVGDDADITCWDFPIMRGRDAVSFPELVEHLESTVEDREQVVVVRKMGVEGQYSFGHVRWEVPSDVIGQ